MSEYETVQKAIEAAQKSTRELLEAQKEEIKTTGQENQKLRTDFQQLQDELKAAGARLFDLEQKGGAAPEAIGAQKSFAENFATKALEGWNGSSVNVEVGSFANKWLGSTAVSAGDLVQPERMSGILMPGMRRLTIRQLLSQGRISSNSLEYVRENVYVNNAAPVAEGTLKPESDISFSKQTANVKTIAHWIQASRQIMDDAPALESYVNNRMLFGLALKEEQQLLNGTGTGDDLEGLNKVATAYDTSLSVAADTRADIIAHAVYQVTESEFDASGIILNPRDWHAIAMLKDAEGRYIFGGPSAFAANVMWGLPVVPTRAQAKNTFTVGGFDLCSQVWDRMDATIEVSREDRDNFVKNMLTILCEERLALAHYRPQAIIKGTFA